jgi:signal transduction histidine kinase
VVVGIATLLMYFLLTGMIGRASTTIAKQQAQLNEKVLQLTDLLSKNRQLHNRVQRAARRTTPLNEQFLHRISSDLHDGPIQDIALALLRVESIVEACQEGSTQAANGPVISEDLNILHTALGTSLKEIRSISNGLRLPELEGLSTERVARRAVRDYKRKTQAVVELTIEDIPKEAPMPVKITLFRVIQEALINGFRYANGEGQSVRVWGDIENLNFEILDTGSGFAPSTVSDDSNLGLAGMRERVELLGGSFQINSGNGHGTQIHVTLPLEIIEEI